MALNEAILAGEATISNSYVLGQASERPLCRPLANFQLFRDGSLRASLGSQIGNPSDIYHDLRPAQARALGASYVQTSSNPRGNAYTLLLGNRGDDGDYCVLKDPAGIEILFGEAPVAATYSHVNSEWALK